MYLNHVIFKLRTSMYRLLTPPKTPKYYIRLMVTCRYVKLSRQFHANYPTTHDGVPPTAVSKPSVTNAQPWPSETGSVIQLREPKLVDIQMTVNRTCKVWRTRNTHYSNNHSPNQENCLTPASESMQATLWPSTRPPTYSNYLNYSENYWICPRGQQHKHVHSQCLEKLKGTVSYQEHVAIQQMVNGLHSNLE